MSAEHSVDVPLDTQVEQPPQGSLVATDKRAVESLTEATQRQIYALMAYYMVLLVICTALILFLIGSGLVPLEAPKDLGTPDATRRVLAAMIFLVSGAVVGSVLYNIRMLFRLYIK